MYRPGVNKDLDKYVLIADAPPLKKGGHGGHVLGWNWVEAVGTGLKLVITHRFNGRLSKTEIQRDLRVPTLLYPDLSSIHFPRTLIPLKWLFESLLSAVWLPRISGAIAKHAGQRLFAFVGNDISFLLFAILVQRFSRLPLDVYLVDDLEESARLGRRRLHARFTRWLEPRLLRRADRIFGISRGFVEHLRTKYGIESEWLPIPIPFRNGDYHAYRRTTPDIRRFTYLGAVNPLYLEALRQFLHSIRQWNSAKNSFELRLLLMTYSDPSYVQRELGSGAELEILYRASTNERRRRARESWAVLLPNSFEDDVRVMVSTSFPTKLTEALLAGRPLVVFGPEHAALASYFNEHQLPLCVTSPHGLNTVLQEIERLDSAGLIQQYRTIIERNHSAEKLKQILAGVSAPEPGSKRGFATLPRKA